jgi:CRISPR-associated endonuclease/helicase Cas3
MSDRHAREIAKSHSKHPSYLRFWGKQRGAIEGGSSWHAAAYHCLDVAASARALLEANDLLRRQLAELLAIPDQQVVDLLTFWMALHDVGKFSAPFSAQIEDLWLPEMGERATVPDTPRHGEAGFLLWDKVVAADIAAWFPDGRRLVPLARAIFGHHGKPVAERLPATVTHVYRPFGLQAARDFVRDAGTLLLSAPIHLERERLVRASFAVAGVAVMADWVGSSAAFTYHNEPMLLTTYWNSCALETARSAVREFGLVPCRTAPERSLVKLMGDERFNDLTPMQRWASNASLNNAPTLYIVEDTTGAGKTETALILAHRLIASGRASGAYFALPAMATANALYGRLAKAYLNLFAEGLRPSLVLAHAARDLDRRFTEGLFYVSDPPSGAEAQCSAWIADNRRRSFLAQLGVGTVDQALLAVLPSRFQSVRLAGLMQRVLIIDEAHAYDAYMGQEIEHLLRAHAQLGGSAIVLSATLPQETRKRLIVAYGGRVEEASNEYPLATWATPSAPVVQTPIDPRQMNVRQVPVRLVQTVEEGDALALDAARQGQAVLRIRNTVGDAVETYDQLSRQHHRVELFHARYAQIDRQQREREVLARYGLKSGPQQRLGWLLVATQVVEQSLDLDFDLIVSDIAPVDLLIQRAGRLWRHTRPDRVPTARRQLVVVTPDPVADPTTGWLPSAFARTARVYQDVTSLWLTARALANAGMIDAPSGLRPLIEAVYGGAARSNLPKGIVIASNVAKQRADVDRGMATGRLLPLQNGYAPAQMWEDDDAAQTRLSEPTRTWRLASAVNGRVLPWASLWTDERDYRRLWALSQVAVLTYQLDEPQPAGDDQDLVDAELARWKPWEREQYRLLLLRQSGTGVWIGSAQSKARNGAPVNRGVRYTRQIGLQW